MKNYAKVGNRQGRPGYRTPATFRVRKVINVQRAKARSACYLLDTHNFLLEICSDSRRSRCVGSRK